MLTILYILFSIIGLLLGSFVTYLILHRKIQALAKTIFQYQSDAERHDATIKDFQGHLTELEEKYVNQLNVNRELIRQKSSQATKSGNYVETLAPLLEKFPVNILDKNVSLKHIGDPIDFIGFDFENPAVTFIEIKSGDSALSARQKLVKKMIKEGLVRFVEFRMNSDGTIEVKE